MAFLTASVVDTNHITKALTGVDSVLVKYHSHAQATMELQDGNMSLDFLSIENGGEKVYKESYTFYGVESNKFIFSCEDDKNETYKTILTPYMVNYVPLTCNITQITIDGSGNATVKCNGIFFNGSFGVVHNTISVYCRYKDRTGAYSDWVEMNVTTINDTYSASAPFSVSNYQEIYTFEVKAVDELEEKTTTSKTSSKPGFHWGKDDFAFEIPVEAHKGLRIGENSSLGSGGNYLLFGDSSLTDNYCYIAEVADDVMTIYSRCGINLKTADGFPVNVNGKPLTASAEVEYGEWTPAFDETSAVNYYSEQDGWYSKLGNVVTVGFRIKATCYSGYTDTPIRITGLPYYPVSAAAGGGMCSRAYISENYNFQCYVAETNGTITTRVQECNNETADSLHTSASGCCYSGDWEMTLSGTITYLTY